ncbi:MAG TPA: class I SAM-dependent methyltransferase [Planctomycetota bacterium]|jgi:NDP-4-keto-2,6-dideoxyhexose 3-C-methyltransferase
MHRAIERCRICGNSELASILNLGDQVLTGTFPRSASQKLTAGPLELVKCNEQGNPDACGLVQLRHSYDLSELYGEHYGYRSALNRSMVDHLSSIVKRIESLVSLSNGDLVVDIGSNDGTLLKAYATPGLNRVGVDPAGHKFHKYYPQDIQLISDFFNAQTLQRETGKRKARVITSIAMFYDLDAPMAFMQQIHDVLADDGIWVFEQSYLPAMIAANAYDSICHEHLEFYSLRQIAWMARRVGFDILDVEVNSVNGGSIRVAAAKKGSPYRVDSAGVAKMLKDEVDKGFHTLSPELAFKERVWKQREALQDFVRRTQREGRRLLGYGASTKGNVVLQFCGFTPKDIACIADVNEEKHGCVTPGTHIPIVSEEVARSQKPDYFLVFPWHFRDFIVQREQQFIASGGRLVMPLPQIELIPGA